MLNEDLPTLQQLWFHFYPLNQVRVIERWLFFPSNSLQVFWGKEDILQLFQSKNLVSLNLNHTVEQLY